MKAASVTTVNIVRPIADFLSAVGESLACFPAKLLTAKFAKNGRKERKEIPLTILRGMKAARDTTVSVINPIADFLSELSESLASFAIKPLTSKFA